LFVSFFGCSSLFAFVVVVGGGKRGKIGGKRGKRGGGEVAKRLGP
jgi:hypothetical protein